MGEKVAFGETSGFMPFRPFFLSSRFAHAHRHSRVLSLLQCTRRECWQASVFRNPAANRRTVRPRRVIRLQQAHLVKRIHSEHSPSLHGSKRLAWWAVRTYIRTIQIRSLTAHLPTLFSQIASATQIPQGVYLIYARNIIRAVCEHAGHV